MQHERATVSRMLDAERRFATRLQWLYIIVLTLPAAAAVLHWPGALSAGAALDAWTLTTGHGDGASLPLVCLPVWAAVTGKRIDRILLIRAAYIRALGQIMVATSSAEVVDGLRVFSRELRSVVRWTRSKPKSKRVGPSDRAGSGHRSATFAPDAGEQRSDSPEGDETPADSVDRGS